MLTSVFNAVRAVRWRLWVVKTRLRLARLGCDLRIEGRVPRFKALPHVDTEVLGPETRGSLTLKIGHSVKLGRDVTFDVHTRTHGVVELHDEAALRDRILLQPWGGRIVVGKRCEIRDNNELKSKGELVMEERSILSRDATTHCDVSVTIGAYVGIADRVSIVDSDHASDGTDTWCMDVPIVSGPVVIGANTFVGTNAVILRNTTIGPNSFVGAGAVVMGGEFPPSHLLVGAPARAIRELTPERPIAT